MILRTPRDVGAFLRDRRKSLNLDQATVAARIGVSRQWLIDVEKGKPRAEIGLVLKALATLGVHLMPADSAHTQVSPDAEDIDAIVTRAGDAGQARPRVPGRRPSGPSRRVSSPEPTRRDRGREPRPRSEPRGQRVNASSASKKGGRST